MKTPICIALFLALSIISCKKNDNSAPLGLLWAKISAPTGLGAPGINDLTIDKQGNLWAAFSQGVGKFDGYAWTIYRPFPVDTTQANSFNYAQAIIQDRAGNMWVTIESKGLTYACKFDGIEWTTKFLTGVRVPALAELPDGEIFFGSNATGAYLFDGTNWSQTNCNGLCYSSYSAVTDTIGNVWIGSKASAVVRYSGGSFSKTIIPYQSDYGGNVVCIARRDSGGIFAALSPGGGWKFNDTTWGRLPARYNESNGIVAVFEDKKKRLWLGTAQEGIFMYAGSEVTIFAFNGEKDNIHKIIEDKQGIIWVGTIHGLFKIY